MAEPRVQVYENRPISLGYSTYIIQMYTLEFPRTSEISDTNVVRSGVIVVSMSKMSQNLFLNKRLLLFYSNQTSLVSEMQTIVSIDLVENGGL